MRGRCSDHTFVNPCAGVYKYQNGDRYEGDFKDDMKCGKGTYYYFDGAVKEGMWENDKLVTQENAV